MVDIIYYLKKNMFKNKQLRVCRDNLLLVILFVFIIFITGCSGPVGGNTSSKMITGYDGLTLQFMEGNFEEVFAGDPFAIAYFISNSGTSDVTGAHLTITSMGGINENTRENADLSPIALKGKSFEYPYPEEKYYEAFFTAINNLNKLDYKKETISFNLCYAYATSFATTVCIDTRISTQDQRRPACSSKSVSGGSGQGAPIAVTNIVPEMLVASNNNIRPQFKIYATNKGKGRAIYPKADSSNPCQDSKYDFDTISIKAFLSDVELTCSPKKITVRSGNSYFRCYVSDNDIANFPSTTLNYVAPLRVELDYYYTESFKYPLMIKRAAAFSTTTNTLSEGDNCGPYQAKNTGGTCEDLCSFCLTNNNHEKCRGKEGLDYLSNAYSCSCSHEECLRSNTQTSNSCLFGYCEGSKYCCKDKECGSTADGALCGTNNAYACENKKCSSKTQCEYWYSKNGFSCNAQSNCDMATINPILNPNSCDGDKMCCKKATKGCDLKYQVEYNGDCMDLCIYCSKDYAKTDSRCVSILLNKNYDNFFSCLSMTSTKCAELELKGLCIKGYCKDEGGTSRYCAKPESLFCVGKSYGTECGDNYVCDGVGRCMNTAPEESQCLYYKKINPSVYPTHGCYISNLCLPNSIITDNDGYCPNSQSCCITT
jgi:hypothetical protein